MHNKVLIIPVYTDNLQHWRHFDLKQIHSYICHSLKQLCSWNIHTIKTQTNELLICFDVRLSGQKDDISNILQ